MHTQAEQLHKPVPVSSHWGNYLAEAAHDKVVAIHPCASDPDPTPVGISWSLRRSEFGEQSYRMAALLSAMPGYAGLPGERKYDHHSYSSCRA